MELTTFNAADDVRLHGALHPPTSEAALACDAAIFLHGAGSNFYSSSLFNGLMPMLQQLGLTVFAINTRGHDSVCTLRTPQGGRPGGAAFEVVDECRHDVRGAVDFLADRGLRKIMLIGHSLGALKAIYSQARDPHENVARIIAISPPLLSYAKFSAGPRGKEFRQMMTRAEQLVAASEGDFLLNVTIPLPLLISAVGYVDKYGPAERYNLLNFANTVSPPTNYIFGEREVSGNSEAFAGLDATMRERGADVSVVERADHFYSRCGDALAETVRSVARRSAT